jgi:hypothetical protein
MKKEQLKKLFKSIVYPYMGSGMLTNTTDESVIENNANICMEWVNKYVSDLNKWISIDIDLPKLNEEYIVAIDLEDGQEGLCSFSAEYRVNENKWVWSNTEEECQGTVLFWKEKPEPPIIPFKKNPIQESKNLDSFERLSYGQCVHGENLASCTDCNKPENNYYERLPKTK